jgi:L-ascorbate metabolism protein UlaG (beta-lactamase superfamily)
MSSTLLNGLSWLGHASFRLKDRFTIYFDPWQLRGPQPKADLIFISHAHHDHLSVPDVKKLAGPGTTVVATADSIAKLKEANVEATFETSSPGARLVVMGLSVECPAAYNANKKFHPKQSGWVGYRVQLEGRSVYHTGDCDNIPEVRATKADLLLIPVGGTYTMTAEEAADAAQAIKPGVAVPMHWGKIVGSVEDAHLFKARAGVPVTIMEVER